MSEETPYEKGFRFYLENMSFGDLKLHLPPDDFMSVENTNIRNQILAGYREARDMDMKTRPMIKPGYPRPIPSRADGRDP